MKLRGTQEYFVNKAIEELKSSKTRKTVFVAPVAYGKSLCIAKIIEGLNASVIIIQPNREILLQNFEKYTQYGNKASIFCSSLSEITKRGVPYVSIDNNLVKCKELSKVTFATAKSLINVVEEVNSLNYQYLIIDECHLHTRVDSEIKRLITFIKIKNILGVTATPVILTAPMEGATIKMINRCKDNIFSNIGHIVQVKEMIDSKYWSPLIYKVKNVNLDSLEYNTSGSDFTEKSLNKTYIINNTDDLCRKAVNYCYENNRKSILIFAPDIDKAEALKASISGSEVIHSKLKKEVRTDIINRFKKLEIRVLINVQILTVGFDHPLLDTIILLRPTSSISLYYQIIGRATRIHPNKKDSWIIDLSGNLKRFGKVEDLNYEEIPSYGWGLFSGERLLTGVPIQNEKIITKSDIKSGAFRNEYSQQTISTKNPNTQNKHLGNIVFPFGKYKGKKLISIPLFYLKYALDNFDLYPQLKKEITEFYNIKTK